MSDTPDAFPIAYDAYQDLAEAYDAKVDTKPHNAYYDRPAVLSLLPDVAGKDVLDAGCGPGAYAAILLKRGARLVACDVSEKMIECARRRVGDRAKLFVHNLARPLTQLSDGSFDVVVSPLVLNYIQNLDVPLREFYRVLRPGGTLVFSMEHPTFTYQYHRLPTYFLNTKVEATWGGFGRKIKMPAYRRSLQDTVNPIADAGFRLTQILEPQPTAEFEAVDPQSYRQLCKFPSFICFKAVKGLVSGS